MSDIRSAVAVPLGIFGGMMAQGGFQRLSWENHNAIILFVLGCILILAAWLMNFIGAE